MQMRTIVEEGRDDEETKKIHDMILDGKVDMGTMLKDLKRDDSSMTEIMEEYQHMETTFEKYETKEEIMGSPKI